jgi:hypothetical protein
MIKKNQKSVSINIHQVKMGKKKKVI